MRIFLLTWLIGLMSFGAAHAQGTCSGRILNPVTDICWSCMLPISLGPSRIADFGPQEDNGNAVTPACSCVVNPIVGLSIGFWEPARQVEVVRRPYCFPTLGGVDLNAGLPAPESARFTHSEGDGDGGGFYQAHFYLNPVLYWLGVVTDFPCLEQGALDLVYMTELDPLWADDELSMILHPDALLFANPVAVAACAADCVAASLGFGVRELFWCAGCQGVLTPAEN